MYLCTFDVPVSLFLNSKSVNSKPISLKTWIETIIGVQCISPKTSALLASIRTEEDEKKQQELKRSLPMITPATQIKHRKKDTPFKDVFINYSGFMQFDVDSKDNPDLDVVNMKEIICSIPYVQFCALSTRAKGYWGLFKITEPDKVQSHFDYMEKLFHNKNIKLDNKGRNPKDARFYTYDPDAYINPDAKVFYHQYKPEPKRPTENYIKEGTKDEVTNKIINMLRNISVQKYSRGGKAGYHNGRLKAGYLAGGYIEGGLLDERIITDELIKLYESRFSDDSESTRKKEIKAITDSIEKGKSSPIRHFEMK